MLPTFVIGLREGLEAALIVGIIAAFLRKQGRRDLLRFVLAGVATATALCLAVGILLRLYSANLPQRQQEGLETVIGILAVGMVTYMVVWMRRNSRALKGQLEGLAAGAIAGHAKAGRAMVLMAFLAVIREGFETVVFLLAAFNETGSNAAAGAGALIGLLVAVALGYGIYRGGVRLNLSKFFRATGLVLVLVAAGLVVNALHTAHEAGWLNAGQGATVDLSALVRPGSVQASLLTGMLGVQSRPVLIEVLGWLAYLVPVGLYVAWPPGRRAPARLLVRGGAAVAALAGIAALVLLAAAPEDPAPRPATRDVTAAATQVVRVVEQGPDTVTVRVTADGRSTDLRLADAGAARHAGVATDLYRATTRSPSGTGPATLTGERVAELNGGRLPIGLSSASGTYRAAYTTTTAVQAWVDTRTGRVVDLRRAAQQRVTVTGDGTAVPLAQAVPGATSRFAPATVAAAAIGVRADAARRHDRALVHALAALCGVLALAGLLCATSFALLALRDRRTRAGDGGRPVDAPGVGEAGTAQPARADLARTGTRP